MRFDILIFLIVIFLMIKCQLNIKLAVSKSSPFCDLSNKELMLDVSLNNNMLEKLDILTIIYAIVLKRLNKIAASAYTRKA